MTWEMVGVVTIVQESRFQMTDDDGVSHLFILGAHAGAESGQLAQLRAHEARVRVRYKPADNLIGNTAIAVYVAE